MLKNIKRSDIDTKLKSFQRSFELKLFTDC